MFLLKDSVVLEWNLEHQPSNTTMLIHINAHHHPPVIKIFYMCYQVENMQVWFIHSMWSKKWTVRCKKKSRKQVTNIFVKSMFQHDQIIVFVGW